MLDKSNILNNLDDVNIKLEKDAEMRKIKEEIIKRFAEYNKLLEIMAMDAPIGILCLPPAIEKILLDNGFLRVFEITNADFTKIKGLGAVRIRQLMTCLDHFFSML